MPPVIVPAGISLAAFAGAVLSWYGMLRTGIQLMYNDIHAARSAEKDILNMLRDMDTQGRRLRAWKALWFVQEDIPESAFLLFWGEKVYQNIQGRLVSMDGHFKDARKKLRSVIDVPEAKWRNMHSLQKKAKKLRFILMQKDYIQKLIDRLETDLTRIQAEAKDGWRREDLVNRKGEVDCKEIYHVGVAHLLVRIASRTKADADALHSCCRAAQNSFNLELELDMFNHTNPPPSLGSGHLSSSGAVSRKGNSTAIAAADKKGYIVWNILSQRLLPGDQSLTRLHVEREANAPTSGGYNYTTALDRIIRGNAAQCHFQSSHIWFNMTMARIPCNIAAEPRQSLRQLLLENPTPNLGNISKFRLTFELAQACFLLLRTTWFRRVCSCEIQCGRCTPESTEFTYRFQLRMGDFIHEPPQWRAASDPWCAGNYNWNFLTEPLRRLGILLVEIVLQKQIGSLEVRINNSRNIERMAFVQGDRRTAYVLRG